MAFTYLAAESSDLHKVRGRIGDTDSADALLDDDTITTILTEYTSVLAAAVECCRRILAKLSRQVDRSGVGLSSERSQVIVHYERVLANLRRESAASSTEMFVGGTTISEKTTLEADSDFRARPFSIGMDDYT